MIKELAGTLGGTASKNYNYWITGTTDEVAAMKTFFKGILLVLALIAVFLAGPVFYYFPCYNFRVVSPGAFYGSRQMGGAALESTINKYGIGTVFNLRGAHPGEAWYDAEAAACERTGATLVNLGWSKSSLPDPASLMEFVETIESGKGAFLAHCSGGTHRTGVASAVFLLLQGEDVPTARKQFRLGFNDAPIGQLLDLYEKNDLAFRQWVEEIYPNEYETLKARDKSMLPLQRAPEEALQLALNTASF